MTARPNSATPPELDAEFHAVAWVRGVRDQMYAMAIARVPQSRKVHGMIHAHTAGALHQRFDDHAIFQAGAGVDDGGWRYALAAEPGLRAKRISMQLTGDLDERPERLRGAQHRDRGGNAGLEPRAHQTGAGLGRGELIDVFQVVEERQMHRAGFVE